MKRYHVERCATYGLDISVFDSRTLVEVNDGYTFEIAAISFKINQFS